MATRYELIPRTRDLISLWPTMRMFDTFFDDNWLSDIMDEDKLMMPAIDISENGKEYMITGEIPGVDAKDIDVTLTDGILTIKGEKKRENEEKNENYHRFERHYGSFERSFRIPEKIDADKVDATYKNGVFKLSLPKIEPVEPKKIEVKASKSKKRTKAKKES
jgi:HSP20 family protein